MKIDVKSILIIVFLTISLFFGYKWYFDTDNSNYKNQIKELRIQNRFLEKQRDSINVKINLLETELLKLTESEKTLLIKIGSLSAEIESAKKNANKSKTELEKLRTELANTREKIKHFKNNPPNRTGDNLLNSLKNKLK
jgi:chromosome segregation ATPase